ncbi:extracellular solute-binding protein [Propionivibrio limicola]|uniref:extracellular solute-binding protein n=1 Tax=Propionivibrio limicola TaxID=167645 RepID=UPI001B8652FC|nr:extracellular solute-binding protein [Propionivibrio limicola]
MSFPRMPLAIGGWMLAASVIAAPSAPQSPVSIELSHQLDEERAERLEPLIESFNKQQKNVQVKLVRRVGGEAPKQLNLVTREEQKRFVDNKAQFKPLHQVMREAKEKFDASKLSPELREGLTDGKGQLMALPVAYSTPVLYINREAFRKAGLDPDKPPKTWFEAQEVAGKLADAGNACPFTTSWPAWVLLDNLSAWNGAETSDGSGKLAFNGLVQVKHVAMMATWYKSKYFSYFGRRDEADRRFANGECGMLTSSSSLYASFADKKLDVGVATLPYHDDVYGAPKATLADGASLWVASGLKPAETKGVAKFVNYVLGPEVQVNLTLAGGFLPMTPVARAAANSKLLKSDLAGLHVAYAELQGKPTASAVRVSQVEPLRTIVEEELESVWADKKPAKEALDNAVARGNAILPSSASARVAKSKRRM